MLIGVFGKMGSGKTLFMTIFSSFLRHKIPEIDLWANYNLKESLEVDKISELIKIENGLICLDEFWITMDSRGWKDNVFLTNWINQTRKKNLLVLYTTQSFHQIDIRVRHATDLLVFCEKLNTKPMSFRYSFLSNPSGRILKTFKLSEKNASEFYESYNSFEVVKSLIRRTEQNTYNNKYRSQ